MNANPSMPYVDKTQYIENYLQSMLPKVAPREDFVVSLRQRLLNMPIQRHWLPTAVLFLVITLAGLVSGLILIATSIRALVTIFATLGLIYKVRTSSRGSSSPSTQPSG